MVLLFFYTTNVVGVAVAANNTVHEVENEREKKNLRKSLALLTATGK